MKQRRPRPQSRRLRTRETGKCKETGKVSYPSSIDAKLAKANIDYSGKRTEEKAEQRPYRCEFCRNFHLTSQNRRPRR